MRINRSNYLNIEFVFILITLFLFGQSVQSAQCDKKVCAVSMVELICNGEKYNNKLVAVTGFFKKDFELSVIFLTKDHEQINDLTNSIHVDIGNTKLNNNEFWKQFGDSLALCQAHSGQYLTFFGRFKVGRSGHLGAWNSSLDASNMCIVKEFSGVDGDSLKK